MENVRTKHNQTAVKTAAVALAIAAVLWLRWAFSGRNPTLRLSLVDAETGTVYLSQAVETGQWFDLGFVHSVNKSLVTERYAMRADGIWLEECRYAAFGAGVATEVQPGQRLLMQPDGTMLLTGLHRLLPDLRVRVGKVTDHVLTLAGQQISLTELCGQNTAVRFVLESGVG